MSTVRVVTRFYSLSIAGALVVALRAHDSSLRAFLGWFWRSKTYRTAGILRALDKPLVALLVATMVSQIAAGVYLLVDWARFGTAGTWEFGVALLLSYPFVAAHVLALGLAIRRAVYFLVHPKKLGKAALAHILERQVKQLRRKNHVTVVAVAGSVGKTSTKFAIAELLGQHLRIRYQAGNYNDRLTVPLVFFDQPQPSIFNVFAWARVIGENEAMVEHPYPYDVVVVELGTDGPGQMKQFSYLKPDVTVLTAIAPEHMEYFGDLESVAREELMVFDFSKRVLVNADDIPGRYLVGREFEAYSLRTNAGHNFYASTAKQSLQGQELSLALPTGTVSAHTNFVGDHGAKLVLAAAASAHMLGMHRKIIAESLPLLAAPAGRMRVFPGLHQSTIIDDTYNASPTSVLSALRVLYDAKASSRIAVLGSMAELGSYAREAHQTVGAACDAKKLDLVVTIGANARRWLAPAARAQGCQVRSFASPIDAGNFVRKRLQKGTVVLVKGSQNGVFAEEATKLLLAHPADTANLVRQSRVWLRTKAKQFDDVTL